MHFFLSQQLDGVISFPVIDSRKMVSSLSTIPCSWLKPWQQTITIVASKMSQIYGFADDWLFSEVYGV